MKTKNMKTHFWNTTWRTVLLGLMWSFALTIISLWFLTSSTFARNIVLDTNNGDEVFGVEQPQDLYITPDPDTPAPNTPAPSAAKSEKDFPYTSVQWRTRSTTDIGNILFQTNQEGSLLEKYLNLFDINYSNENWKAIAYVQVVINYVLSLLWIIAVVLIMYSFYSIFLSSKSEEAISNAKKTVMWASIGLILVGVSAYIVNFIFYIYNKGI